MIRTRYIYLKSPRQKTAPKQPAVFWEVIRNLIAAAAIYLFYCGWVYLYFFLKRFGISIHNSHIELTSFYVYGYLVFSDLESLIVLVVNLAIVVALYANRNRISNYHIIVLIMLISLFPQLFFSSKAYAIQNANEIIDGKLKVYLVYFNFKKEFYKSLGRDSLVTNLEEEITIDNKNAELFLKKNGQGELFLFFENDSEYFVYSNPNVVGGRQIAVEIFRINKSNLNFTKVNSDF